MATKLIYRILNEMFNVSKDINLRVKAIQYRLIEKILDRVVVLTGEKPRTYVSDLFEKKEEIKVEVIEEEIVDAKPKEEPEKKKGRSGVGYTTGTGTVWNVAKYMQEKDSRNSQI